MSKTVEPHNYYFSAQFLLTFTVAGIHQIYVDTALLDTDDALWNAGPKAQLSVKIYDESGSSSKRMADLRSIVLSLQLISDLGHCVNCAFVIKQMTCYGKENFM